MDVLPSSVAAKVVESARNILIENVKLTIAFEPEVSKIYTT
jgi:hypothetical protein